MSDNHIPSGEWKGPTAATFVWEEIAKAIEERMTPLDYEERKRAFLEKYPDCPIGIYIVDKPCEERKPKKIWLIAETGHWRGWIAQMLLRFSFWLGKFTYDNIEDVEE